MKFTAIVPKTPLVSNPVPALEAALLKWAGGVHREVAKYPRQRRTTYRRTGTLKRLWWTHLDRHGGALVAEVENLIDYAPFVQGENQSEVMRAKGWSRIDEIGERHLKQLEKHTGEIFERSVNH